MSIFCALAGLLCLLYFVVLMVYSGFTSAFYLIWPLMAAGSWAIGWLFHIHFFQQLPAVAHRLLLGLTLLGLLFFLLVEGMILKGSVQMPSQEQDYVIVLGAHVRRTGPSKALALRLDRALEYAKAHPDTIFIVSGGQGANEPCTESSAMKAYLTERGLDAARILEENRSTNTRENLIYSREQIPPQSRIGIISNGFHICRALHLAARLGYPHAVGIPAKSDLITQPANLLREFFAVVKDFWLQP